MNGLLPQLRRETADLHRQAERSGIMPALLKGQLDRPRYALLLRNLHAIYDALEAALQQHAGHPGVDPLRLAPIYRAPALAHDLAVLHGSTWARDLPLVPATQAYCQRLADLTGAAAPLLAAHVYVRYLGDLSGGQILRRVVAASPELGGAAAVQFYDFGPPAQADALGRALRDALAALPVDAPLLLALVAEAQQSFAWHIALFDQLAAQVLDA